MTLKKEIDTFIKNTEEIIDDALVYKAYRNIEYSEDSFTILFFINILLYLEDLVLEAEKNKNLIVNISNFFDVFFSKVLKGEKRYEILMGDIFIINYRKREDAFNKIKPFLSKRTRKEILSIKEREKIGSLEDINIIESINKIFPEVLLQEETKEIIEWYFPKTPMVYPYFNRSINILLKKEIEKNKIENNPMIKRIFDFYERLVLSKDIELIFLIQMEGMDFLYEEISKEKREELVKIMPKNILYLFHSMKSGLG